MPTAGPRSDGVSQDPSLFDPRPSGLRGIRPVETITLADLGLEPGAPTVSGRAIVADALELMKKPSLTGSEALLEAALQLGLTLRKEDGLQDALLTAIGPAALPLLEPSYQGRRALSLWQLQPGDVVPTLLEAGGQSVARYTEQLVSLASNPSLTDAHRLAVHDAVVRSAAARRLLAPVLDGSVTLERFVENLRTLGQGEDFARALPVVGEALIRGEYAPPGPLMELADRALTSSDVNTRANAGALFWYSSRTSEPAVKAYLKSVLMYEPGWSSQKFDEAIEAYRQTPTSTEGTLPVHGLKAEGTVAIWGLLKAAPPEAAILPAVQAAVYTKGPLQHVARGALEWSTLPMEQRIAAADLVYGAPTESGPSYSATRLVGSLLAQRPDLARHAPRLVQDQLGIVGRYQETAQTDAFRELTSRDYLERLAELKASLQELPPGGHWKVEQRLRAIDPVLTKPSFETHLSEWTTSVAVAAGREAGLSSQQMFEAIRARGFNSSEALETMAMLLIEPGVAPAFAREHLPALLASFKPGDLPPVVKALLASRPSKELVVDVLGHLARAGVVTNWVADALIQAGVPRELALAMLSKTETPPAALRIAPSTEVPRTAKEWRQVRMADFKARAAEQAPFTGELAIAPVQPRKPSWLDSMLPELFRPESKTPAELELAFGAPSTDTQANPRRFLADVRHGMTYPELRERYSLLGLDWAFADQAAAADQLRVLFTRQQDTTYLLHDLAAVATPNLSLETKRDILRDVFSHARLSTEATNYSVSATVTALIAGWPESLEFLVPSILAPITDGSIRFQGMTDLTPLLLSPKLPKEAALELVWALAEMASRAPPGRYVPGSRDEAAIRVIFEFARDRADLTVAERASVNQAVALVNRPP